ncbi:bZIP transcription factor [Sporobolomyces koalae]|uniref:bZIP transcription factor n=1 Tax=Sporobolomyces koalae TaxID=500713 RepID=UPI003181BAD9
MTGTRGKRIKLSPSTHAPSIPIDPNLVTNHDPGSPAYESPNVSPQPHGSASGLNGTPSTDRAAERKERNRLAAQRSRDKRAQEFAAVAAECDQLRGEVEELKIRIEEQEHELKLKDERIHELEQLTKPKPSGNGTLTTTTGNRGLSDLVQASNFLDQL